MFQEPKTLTPKREVEHEIQLLPEFALPYIGLYRQYLIAASGVKK